MPPEKKDMPDLDSMSPEELMAWMETLARRQTVTDEDTEQEHKGSIFGRLSAWGARFGHKS